MVSGILAAMKRFLGLVLVLLLATTVAQATPGKQKSAEPKRAQELAKAVTMVTGIAISPLLGTGAIGAYEWFGARDATPEEQARLPWYAHPGFWIPALLLVCAVAFKDAAGTALPPGLKKPLDVCETVENKVSGLVAAGAVVPMLAAVFPMTTGNGDMVSANVCLAGFATFNWSSLLNLLTIPFALTAYALVWLVSNAINVLILLSPWGVVDAALKAMRTALLGTLVLVHTIDPVWGAVLSLVVIVIAYFLAGWSFRLTVCGSIYIWDFLTGRKHRFKPNATANWMFTARKINKVPTRTYGQLRREPTGQLVFDYRPWLFGARKTVVLPAGNYVVGRGLFYSEVMRLEGEEERTLLLLPPRYWTHEEELLSLYAFVEVRPIGLRRAWRWLKSLLGFGPQPVPAT
jgi:hypothetical protein